MTYEKELHIGENSVTLAILDTAGNVSQYIKLVKLHSTYVRPSEQA